MHSDKDPAQPKLNGYKILITVEVKMSYCKNKKQNMCFQSFYQKIQYHQMSEMYYSLENNKRNRMPI